MSTPAIALDGAAGEHPAASTDNPSNGCQMRSYRDHDNPYPKGSLLEWAYDQLMDAERAVRYRTEELERGQQNVAGWRQLLETLGGEPRNHSS